MSKRSWGVLLYAMVGSEAEHALLHEAVGDMRGALRSEECAIAVQINGSDAMERHWISNDRYESQLLAPVDGADKEVLTRFLNDGSRWLDSSSTALVIWAHGDGVDVLKNYLERYGIWPQDSSLPWPDLPVGTRGLLAKYKAGTRLGSQGGTRFLTNDDVRSAIARSDLHRVELLAFNACVMGLFEVAFELRSVTEVLAFSQVFSETWPYGAIVKELSLQPPPSATDLGKLIVRCVASAISSGERTDAASVVAPGATGPLLHAFDRYAERVTELVTSSWPAVRKAIMETAQRVHDPYQVDLLSLLGVLGAGDPVAADAARELRQALENDVILGSASHSSHPRLHGLSIFCPKATQVDVGAAYGGFLFRASKWPAFLVTFQNALRKELGLAVRAA